VFNNIKRVKAGTATALSTTAAMVLDFDNNRGQAIIQNLDASIVVTLGFTSGITAGSTSGVRLAANEIFVHTGSERVWAVAASGTPSLGVTVETTSSNPSKRTEAAPVALSTTVARISRKDTKLMRRTVQNNDASIVVWVGRSDVAANAGVKLPANGKAVFLGTDELYAVAASGTPSVTVIETKIR
jgi:hypothetical protein